MWFVRLGGRESGPFSEDRLRSMLKLNQFSPLHQVSRDRIRWESAAPLVSQLSGNGAGQVSSTADKWALAAKQRQEDRAATESALRSQRTGQLQSRPTQATGWGNAASSTARRAAAAAATQTSLCTSVQIQQACKSVVDRTTGGPRILLHPVSLSLMQGELTAIVGPSGSGKSTWIGLLTGRAQPTSGRITVFGRDLNRDFGEVKRLLSTVPQMDAFLTSLKVRTSLYYSACLRLPANTTHVNLVSRVDTVLVSVGLEACGDRRISQLSGGQLRRLSLAQELLSDPDVLYLDEVTSGLDEQSDAEIMALLRTLSASGRTIMIITHHLHNLSTNCHKIVVLAEGGYMLFYGSPDDACASFQVDDVTELLPAVRKMDKAEVIERYQNANQQPNWSPPDVSQPPSAATAPSQKRNRSFPDFVVLVRRQLAVLVSSPLSTVMSLAICFVIGVLLLVSYPDISIPDKPVEPANISLRQKFKEEVDKFQEDLAKKASDCGNIAFILTISSFFLGCLAGTRELVMERRLFWRESGTEMSIGAYLGSKLLVHSFLVASQAGALGITVVMVNHAECSWVGVAIANSAAALSGLCTGFFISAASRSEAVATKLMLLAVLPQMILSGALQKGPPKDLIGLLSKILITSHYVFLNICGLFPEDIRKLIDKGDCYSMPVMVAAATFHSAVMLAATAFFLKRTVDGEDPLRSE